MQQALHERNMLSISYVHTHTNTYMHTHRVLFSELQHPHIDHLLPDALVDFRRLQARNNSMYTCIHTQPYNTTHTYTLTPYCFLRGILRQEITSCIHAYTQTHTYTLTAYCFLSFRTHISIICSLTLWSISGGSTSSFRKQYSQHSSVLCISLVHL
jgi:hypothetical protein